jgi:hypothetical protein
MYLDSRRDVGSVDVTRPYTDADVAAALRYNLPGEEKFEPVGLLADDGKEVTVAPSLKQIEDAVKRVSVLVICLFFFRTFCLLSSDLFLLDVTGSKEQFHHPRHGRSFGAAQVVREP